MNAQQRGVKDMVNLCIVRESCWCQSYLIGSPSEPAES